MRFLQNKKVRAVLLAEIIILVAVFIISVYSTGRSEGTQLTHKDLFAVSGDYEESRGGYYIDESTQYKGIFTCGPYQPLQKGIYTVTVFYNTDTDENTCYAFSETARYFYGSLQTDKNVLKSGLTSKSFKVWLDKDLEDFEIRSDYNGKGNLTILEIHIEKSKATYALLLLKVVGVFCFFNIICYLYFAWKQGKYSAQHWKVGAGLTAVVLLASLPLFYDFLIYGTDLRFHLMRIDGVKEAIRTGQIPVKIAPLWLNGYGFAVSSFYGNLFLYIPAVFRLLGVTLQDSYKIYCVVVICFCSWSSYYCMKNIARNQYIGLLGSLLFTLAPYHIVMLYSGWTGAFTAYAFLPLIFYGGYQVFTAEGQEVKNAWIPMTVGFAGIIQSHILTCEMVGIFMIICCIINIRKIFQRDRFFTLAKTVVITILVNAWFLVPFLDYMGGNFNIRSDRTSDMYNIQGNGIPLANLFSLYQNTVQGSGTRIDPYSIGFPLLIGSIFCITSYFTVQQKKEKVQTGIIPMGIGLIAVWLCTNLFPWDKLSEILGPLSSLVVNIEYPWRFLAIANIFLTAAVCLCFAVQGQNHTVQKVVIAAMAVATILSVNDEYSQMLEKSGVIRAYDMEAMDYYDYKEGWGIQEYLPVGTDISLLRQEGPIANADIEIMDYRKQGVSIDLSCRNLGEGDGSIEVPLIYYPGYQAVDEDSGKKLELRSSDNNVMQIMIPIGYEGSMRLDFVGHWYWWLSYGVSAFAVGGLIIIGFRKRRRK